MEQKVSAEMAKLALEALEDKKAEDIRIIDISTVSVLADYFIIANGTNRSQIQALATTFRRSSARPDTSASRWKDIRRRTGCFWISAM